MLNQTTSTSSPFTRNDAIYFSVVGVLGSLSVLLNTLVLFTLWRNKTKEFRNGTSYIIGNLALADSLTGVAVLMYVCRCIPIIGLQLSMIWTTILASLLSLILLSIERLFALAYSFKLAVVTVRRTIIALLIIWVLSISCGVSVFFYKDQSVFALTIIYESAVLIFAICHTWIFWKMIHVHRQVGKLGRKISTSSSNPSGAIVKSVNVHVNKVVLILVAILVITVIPYIIATQITFWYRLDLKPRISKSTIDDVMSFAYFFYPIELLNFVVNPLIYSWRLKRYRQAFIDAFKSLNCRRPEHLDVSGRLITMHNNNEWTHRDSSKMRKETVTLKRNESTSV